MHILTPLQLHILMQNGAPENSGKDHYPEVKLFLPGTDSVWLITELDFGDLNIAFGLCDLGLGFPELGYVDLRELASVRGPFDLSVMVDKTFTAKYPLSKYAAIARQKCSIKS